MIFFFYISSILSYITTMGSVISTVKNFFVPQKTEKPIKVYEENMCGICMGSIIQDVANRDSYLRVLRCGHAYHKTCIDEWLQIGSTCPHCRTTVVQKLFNISVNVKQWIAKGMIYPLVGGWFYGWLCSIPYLSTLPILITTAITLGSIAVICGLYSVGYHLLIE